MFQENEKKSIKPNECQKNRKTGATQRPLDRKCDSKMKQKYTSRFLYYSRAAILQVSNIVGIAKLIVCISKIMPNQKQCRQDIDAPLGSMHE